jgi:hypothetical protein
MYQPTKEQDSSMRVQPISAEQAESDTPNFEPFPPGDYDFLVNEAIDDHVSPKTGGVSMMLTLHVFNKSGTRRIVWDYLPHSASGQWKTRQFAEAVGLVRQYEAGGFEAHEVLGKPGRVKLKYEAGTPDYPKAKNTVEKYLKPVEPIIGSARSTSGSVGSKAKVHTGGDLNDEVPF